MPSCVRGPLVTACLALLAPAAFGAEPIDFGRDIRPILADNCFHCHGQDAGTREGKLRLDTAEGQKKPGVILPGNPDESELILRILSPYEDEVMPPPDSHRTLSPEQKELLVRWVREGAAFTEHWAFSAPVKPALPAVQNAAWPRSPIDHFILARLEREGLAPAPETERARWLRRVTLDLTGLPPTVAELDAFIADRSPSAYEAVVDRLLASPRYGERMATDWLDLARYADTHGYQMDRPRAMWPYRDWVIDAFNRNLPFDRFLTEQLAGDLLPAATREQKLATAFNRLHAQNEEGGIVDEEYRIAYVNDRVNTFGTAVLGLTMDCTRCHDHKFDPLTQRDFYSLSAFFHNIDEAGAISYLGFSDVMPPPVLKLPDATAEQELAALDEAIAAQSATLAVLRAKAAGDFEAWLATRSQTVPVPDGLAVALDFESTETQTETDAKTGAVRELVFTPNAVASGSPARLVEGPSFVAGPHGQAAVLDGEDGFALADAPVFTRGDAFSISLWLKPGAPAERAVVFHRSLAYTDAGSRGYELVLEHGRAAFGLHRHWPGNALKVVSRDALPADTWTHVTLTYDGSSRAAGARIYLNGRLAETEVVRDKLAGDITYDREKQPPLLIGHRFRDSGFKGGHVEAFRIYTRELSGLEAAHLAGRADLTVAWSAPAAALTPAQRDELRAHYLLTSAPGVRDALARLAALRRDQIKRYDRVPEVMVMEEMPEPRPAYILKRGGYDERSEEVGPDTPAVLPPFPGDLPRNRLGLAQWATAPDHPLTARVTVNRLWQQLFERGLVESSDNFGVTGGVPTHPELLDWLAVRFVESGWDVKSLLRELVLSATYRQSSRADPAVRARDPQNLLLARAPARRLTAEMLRDQALFAAGLLVEKRGGPPVKPYQPPGLWEEIAMGKPKYVQGTGDDLYRRSLYTFLKRTVPHPAMLTFDATDRANCTVKRQATSTPLQALVLLNDPQQLEAARFIGTRMLREGGPSPREQTAFAFRLLASRDATAAELATLTAAYAEQEALFATDPAGAAAVLSVGESPADPALPADRLAAASLVASVLLNHDEVTTRR